MLFQDRLNKATASDVNICRGLLGKFIGGAGE